MKSNDKAGVHHFYCAAPSTSPSIQGGTHASHGCTLNFTLNDRYRALRMTAISLLTANFLRS